MTEIIATNLGPEMSEERSQLVSFADNIIINDVPSRDKGMGFLKACMDLEDRIRAFFEPHVKRAHEAHKSLTAARANELKPVETAVGSVKGKLFKFERELEIASAKARLAAEEERLKLIKQQEQEARKLEKKGLDVQAQLVRQQEIKPPPPPLDPPKAEGTYVKTTWRADVHDLFELVKAAAKKPELLKYLQPETKALEAIAKKTEGTAAIPGVSFRQDETFVVKR